MENPKDRINIKELQTRGTLTITTRESRFQSITACSSETFYFEYRQLDRVKSAQNLKDTEADFTLEHPNSLRNTFRNRAPLVQRSPVCTRTKNHLQRTYKCFFQNQTLTPYLSNTNLQPQ